MAPSLARILPHMMKLRKNRSNIRIDTLHYDNTTQCQLENRYCHIEEIRVVYRKETKVVRVFYLTDNLLLLVLLLVLIVFIISI